MRVLVTWGSRMGGTEGIARTIAEELRAAGLDVVETPAHEVGALPALAVDAVILGGALYANRWHVDARRFVQRNLKELRRVPVWLFSSGPLDNSAVQKEIPPTEQVSVVMEAVGALGHATFGGRLPRDAKGFPAQAMAAKHSGDWRNSEQIRRFAAGVARDLPHVRPGVAIDHPAHSPLRLLAHGGLGWAILAALTYGVILLLGQGTALALRAPLATVVFILVARHYFHAHGPRDPLPAAVAFTGIVMLLDLGVIGGLVHRSLTIFENVAGTWLPLALIFLATWAVGALMSTLPWPKAQPPSVGA